MRGLSRAALLAVVAIAGCRGERVRAEPSSETTGMVAPAGPRGMGMGRMDSAGRARMHARMGPGYQARMDSMMRMSPEQRRVHMDSMLRMSPQQRQAIMGQHRRMMMQMMNSMDSGTGTAIADDPAWRALRDSVKADLDQLPKLEGQALTDRLREHMKRAERLLAREEQAGS